MSESDAGFAQLGRRSFLLATALAAAAPIMTEASLARAARKSSLGMALPSDAVIINANENPLGPCKAAIDAIANTAPLGGRYDRFDDQDKFTKTFAEQHGLKPENVMVY